MKELVINNNRKRLLFAIGMSVCGAVLIIAYCIMTGNLNQVYTDVVVEYTAIYGSNKSAEKNLFYIFSLLGAIFYGLFYLRNKWDSGFEVKAVFKDSRYVLVALCIFLGMHYFIYQNVNWFVISMLIISVLLVIERDEEWFVPGIAFMAVCVYGICGLYRLYVYIFGLHSLSIITISLISLFIALFLMKIGNNKEIFIKGIMVTQVFIPFVLLMFLMSLYKYEGDKFVDVLVPYKVQILIWILIALFTIEAVLKIKQNWNKSASLSEVLGNGIFISIMVFNRYNGSGSIVTSDLHHPYENIIGYSQIFDLGQKVFSEYIPVSGMYSIVHGFFLQVFGDGKMTYYYVATNVFYLFVIIAIVFLLRKQVKAEWVLFIALVFRIPDYNRIVLIVPIMLLLSLPQLIKNKNLWLKAWFLSSFLHGLYYPVFGAAVCIGFMPLGLWQIYTYIRSGELKKDIKNIKFWIEWMICFAPVVCGIGLLLGSFKHIRAMSEQTIYADGLTRFGQFVAENFFSYLHVQAFRLLIYYIFSFQIIISIIWLSVALFFKNGNVSIEEKKISIKKPVAGYVSLSIGIMFLVALSYTVIRLDVRSIYARSEGLVYASFIMFIIILSRYMENNPNRLSIFCFSAFIMAVVSAEGFFSLSDDSKLSAYYSVPEGYHYVEDEWNDRLGECFLSDGTYTEINNAREDIKNMDSPKSYLGKFGNFGLFYLFDVRGDSVMEITTIKGYKAVQETVDLIKDKKTIVGSYIDPVANYYFYHWLLTSGEYIWDDETREFKPINETESSAEIFEKNKNIELSVEGYNLGRIAGSWGSSMESLKDIFVEENSIGNIKENEVDAEIDFNNAIDGNDADFIFIDFTGVDENYNYILYGSPNGDLVQDIDEYPYTRFLMKKNYNPGMSVRITWNDNNNVEHSMNCDMDEGKLLVPLGAARGWLFNDHSSVIISVYLNGEQVSVPKINEIKLMKLREVK